MDRELPLLAAIGGFFEWCEQLLTILSGPLLTAGLMIALTDLLTDGRLLATQPTLLYAWAIAMGAGLDAQLIGASVKVGRAARTGHPWHAALYGLLVLALAYVAFIAAQVFATQQADGISTAQALARLGMDGTTWLIQRSALSVALVVLSGLLRYTPPGRATIADERAQLERELELEPLRAQVRLRKVVGMRNIAAAAFAKDAPGYHQDFTEPPPTGPGSPSTASAPPATDDADPPAQAPLRLMATGLTPTERKIARTRARAAGQRESAFALLNRYDGLTRNELARILRCRAERASAYMREWRREQQQQQREQVAQ